jgi:tRNA-splicing ligase RtcB
MSLASDTGKPEERMNGFRTDTVNGYGHSYVTDMNFCIEFARLNRNIMSTLITDELSKILSISNIIPLQIINENHNHAISRNGITWIHRKGATHADKDMFGVIPANMRDGSFIVKGKGCYDALNSASHGAGRIMSRKKAKAMITMEEFEQSMVGIVSNISQSTIDEAPQAYKNILTVMENQSDMVDIIDHIKPIINIKG